MENTIIFGIFGLTTLLIGAILFYTHRINSRISDLNKTLEHQYNLIVKMQSTLKNKSATNAITEMPRLFTKTCYKI